VLIVGAVTTEEKKTTSRELINPFTDDVSESDWFYFDVVFAYSLGLIDGKTATRFAPKDNLTCAEAVKLAACMHQLYTTGEVTLQNGSPEWYNSYADYAMEAGIIDTYDYEWKSPITRSAYMEIFAKSLPEEALAPINTIEDDSIPDVPLNHPAAEAIYTLYRAGVVQGRDAETHECCPDSFILRCEVAATITRMMDNSTRIDFYM
ncbi:MAG: S-layer homology domain-containing protein, partial [Oscillospiraceae bacterium]|nr:S-layer homology domain-containing protein [Oscillospiraceae bacterium]